MGTTTLGDSGVNSLSALARREGVSLAALLRANPGINPNVVGANQRIRIPGSYESRTQSSESQARELARVFANPLAGGQNPAFYRDARTGLRTQTPGAGLLGAQQPIPVSAPNVSTQALEAFFGGAGTLAPTARPTAAGVTRGGRPLFPTIAQAPQMDLQKYQRLIQQGFSEGYARRAASGTVVDLSMVGRGTPGVALQRQVSQPPPLGAGAPGAALARGAGVFPFTTATPGVALERNPGAVMTTGTPGAALARFAGEPVSLSVGAGAPGAALYRQSGIEPTRPTLGAGTPGAALERQAARALQAQAGTGITTTALGAGATARVLAEETAQIEYNRSAYTEAARRNAATAIASGQSVDLTTLLAAGGSEEQISRELGRSMVLLGAGINMEQLDALAQQMGSAIGIPGITGERLLEIAGYRKNESGNWVATAPAVSTGGGAGGYSPFRYPGWGGGGGRRGYTAGGSALVQWRIRYTA